MFFKKKANFQSEHPLGLIAGNGSLPHEIAVNAKAKGYDVFAIGIKGEADRSLKNHVAAYQEFHIGELSRLIKLLSDNQIPEAIFAGGLRKVGLFEGLHFDFQALQLLKNAKNLNDDFILKEIAGLLAKGGTKIISQMDFIDQSLAEAGDQGTRQLSDDEQKSAGLGWKCAKEIGKLDIGQSVIAHQGCILAVEAIDGTDATIARAGQIARSAGKFKAGQGPVLVKIVKPQQDTRFDLPSIGKNTIENCYKSGISAIVVEADKSIILDKIETVKMAKELNIALLATKTI